ncbi:uncharacterized protein HRG_01806 [Hirsutella rhossiliensis]|uniref:Uncharacterized protein n=1 Tax=Hirsutella rhossiliensis TaxID=111463 RepID=A0A9P8N4E4_9HYPO|nr:uncharacterized protein HRG_01806 [Hirsutella rhossiliensis]KAH0966397.1 hypothetical protein HRG_01806 [Hirsutella rhossiliensis]
MKLEALAVALAFTACTVLAAPSNAMAEAQNGVGVGHMLETDLHGMLKRGTQVFCPPKLCGGHDCKRDLNRKRGVRGSHRSPFCWFCPQKDCGGADEDKDDGDELGEGPGRGLLLRAPTVPLLFRPGARLVFLFRLDARTARLCRLDARMARLCRLSVRATIPSHRTDATGRMP